MISNEMNCAILASYVTLKELYNTNKYRSSYQILVEFVKYIIINEKLHSFLLLQMKEKINEVFGFNLPVAVLKTTIKNCVFVVKNDNSNGYAVDYSKLQENSEFNSIISLAERDNYTIIDDIVEFAKEKVTGSYINRQDIVDSLVSFLVDDYSSGKYYEVVSEYILLNSANNKVQDQLQSIKEGVILYIGLNYNISETGSLKNELTLYLDMEVLFNITGLNGELYQRVAADMLDVIAQANKKERKIKLRFFEETKDEIEKFFDAASYVIESSSTPLVNRVAMDNILNGCSSAADVQDKLSDFFYNLRSHYGIIQDEHSNYYSHDKDTFNLESEDDDEEVRDSVKLISHINKLRKGNISYEYTDSGYILVTETKKTLNVSALFIEQQKSDGDRKVCGYALTTNAITNFLWYKLNSGFGGKPYPHSIDAVLKARFVLSKEISKHIMESYETMKKEYSEGKITKEQVASRILGLRSKPTLPEDLTVENLADSLDFSPEFIREYEEKVNADKRLLEEKNREIEALHANHDFEMNKQNQTIKEMEEIIAEKSKSEEAQQSTIDELQAKVKAYEEEKQQEENKKARRQAITKFALRILLKVLCIVVPTVIVVLVSKHFGWDIVQVVSIALAILGVVPLGVSIFKKDVKTLRSVYRNNK